MPVRRSLRLEALLEQWEPEIRKAFLEAVYNQRSVAQVDLIIKYLEKGDIENALRAVNLDPVYWLPWDRTLRQAYEAGGITTAQAVPAIVEAGGFRTVFQFNVRNPMAERWLSDYSSKSITEIVDDQRKMVRNYLAKSLERGTNPRTSALDLVGRINRATGRREGGVIGLTETQWEWVSNYEDALRSNTPLDALSRELRDRRFDPAVRRAAESGVALEEDQIGSMVDAYVNRALRFRAEAISRTETLTSLHAAQDASLLQAAEAGIQPQNIYRVWRTAGDDRVRDSHEEMDGQVRGLEEPFETGDGVLLDFPGDPSGPPEEIINCRCWVETQIDFLAEIE